METITFTSIRSWLEAIQGSGERVSSADDPKTRTIGFVGAYSGTRWEVALTAAIDRAGWDLSDTVADDFAQRARTPESRIEMAKFLSAGGWRL